MRHGRGLRAAAALTVALLSAALLGACGSTGASGEGTISVSGTPSSVATPSAITADALKAMVAGDKAAFTKAARAFRKCDKSVTYDSYVKSPCLKQANAMTASVNAFLGNLRSVNLPPGEYDTLVKDLSLMAKSGVKVATKCRKANDQVCDQALASLRANEQSILWDLDVTL